MVYFISCPHFSCPHFYFMRTKCGQIDVFHYFADKMNLSTYSQNLEFTCICCFLNTYSNSNCHTNHWIVTNTYREYSGLFFHNSKCPQTLVNKGLTQMVDIFSLYILSRFICVYFHHCGQNADKSAC